MKKRRFIPQPPPRPVIEKPQVDSGVVTLTEEEKKGIQGLNNSLAHTKLALADVVMKMQYISETVADLSQELLNKIKETAKAHDLPVDDPTQGSYNFDFVNMTFTKNK